MNFEIDYGAGTWLEEAASILTRWHTGPRTSADRYRYDHDLDPRDIPARLIEPDVLVMPDRFRYRLVRVVRDDPPAYAFRYHAGAFGIAEHS